jgi:hypothetical protein
MMIRLLVRRALRLLACAALVLAAAAPSQGAQVQLPVVLPLQILGADSFCTGGFVAGGTASAPTLTCQTSGGTFGCSIAPSNSSPLLATLVTLTATCSNAAGPVTYIWSQDPSIVSGCPSITQEASPDTNKADLSASTVAASCKYDLSASDGTTTVTPTKSVSYSTTPPPPPPGGVDTSACTAFGLNAKVVVASWTSNTIIKPPQSPNFGPNDALIVQFTTSSVTTSTTTGNISAVEYGDPTTQRAGALSASPCDFTVGLPKVNSGSRTIFNGWNPSFSFTVSNPLTGKAMLQPNTTYYLNITNFVPAPPNTPSAQMCGTSTCNMQITLVKPSGT